MNQTKNKIANNKHTFLMYVAKFAVFFVFGSACINDARSETASSGNYINSATYSNMQPFLNNRMREALQQNNMVNSPDQTSTFSRAAIGSGNLPVSALSQNQNNNRRVVARNSNITATTNVPYRRVMPRSGTSVARSGIVLPQYQLDTNAPRTSSATQNNQGRRVVMRSSRGEASIANRATTETTQAVVSDTSVSTSQCLADYRACMDGYCKREKTPYNHCYCSDELAEIETTLRPEVEEVLRKLVIIKNGGLPSTGMTDAELEQLWQDTFYQHTGTNDMTSLNEALNISWPTETNNMRGKNAFLIGHDYCIQHLRGCFYMVSNLRDSYKSEISRDCATYKTYLNNLKTAGESVISKIEQ